MEIEIVNEIVNSWLNYWWNYEKYHEKSVNCEWIILKILRIEFCEKS